MGWERLNGTHGQIQLHIRTSVGAYLYLCLNLMRVSVKDLFKKRGVVCLIDWLAALGSARVGPQGLTHAMQVFYRK